MAEKEGKAGGVGELLAYAGNRKCLTYLGMGLSAMSQLLGFGPYVCIWLVARDLIAVAPNWGEAASIATYGWWAVGFALASIVVYFAGLMCTHLAAFRCASNIRKMTSEHLLKLPLGYFDTRATGELRRIVDGCAASTETLLAHMLPDISGAVAMVAGLLVLLFAFDWRLGAACLISVVISIGAMATMMGGKGAEFMKAYMGALVKMNKTGTEYVRGIPVVKVFQQTIYSFKAFHDAIAEYAHMAQSYAGTFCRGPQVLNLTALNGLVAFFLPVALLLAPGEADFSHFMTNFTFYAIFSAVVPTAMTKLMFVGEASQMSADSLARIRSIMGSQQLTVPTQPKHPAGSDVRFEDVSFTYKGAETPALNHVSFNVSAGSTLALVGPSGGGKSTCASLIPRFWDVSAGRVLVGGVDVRDMDPCSRRISCLGRRSPITCARPSQQPPMTRYARPSLRLSAMTLWPSSRKASIPCWALAEPIFRAERSSAWRLPVPSSRTPPSWCSTRPRLLPTPKTRRLSSVPLASWPLVVRSS